MNAWYKLHIRDAEHTPAKPAVFITELQELIQRHFGGDPPYVAIMTADDPLLERTPRDKN